jgi:hypothetical protein
MTSGAVGSDEQMFGADEQIRGQGQSDKEAAPALGAVLNHRGPYHERVH